MNHYSNNIIAQLNDSNITSAIENHLKSDPNYQYPINNVPITLDKSIEQFNYLKNVLLQSIDEGIFEEIPVNVQHNINNHIHTLYQYRNNVNQFIVQVENTYYQLMLSGLEFKLTGYDKFKETLNDVSNIRKKYNSAIRGLEGLLNKVSDIENNHKKSAEALESLTKNMNSIDRKLSETESAFDDSERLLENIRKSEQDIENSKKEIVAFKKNIDSYKKDIEDVTVKSTKIIEDFEKKREEVDGLIRDSEEALKLKASEGMSAALSVQYEKEDNVEKRKQWLISSFVFIIVAFIGVGFLIFKFSIAGQEVNSNSLNAIIARIIFVGISIGAASFSANQFLRQKRIADDYAYKLVLAKSIVAFAQEIKKHDPKKSAEYLTNVLNELSKSPVQYKTEKDSINTKNIGLFEKIVGLIKVEK